MPEALTVWSAALERKGRNKALNEQTNLDENRLSNIEIFLPRNLGRSSTNGIGKGVQFRKTDLQAFAVVHELHTETCNLYILNSFCQIPLFGLVFDGLGRVSKEEVWYEGALLAEGIRATGRAT